MRGQTTLALAFVNGAMLLLLSVFALGGKAGSLNRVIVPPFSWHRTRASLVTVSADALCHLRVSAICIR